MEKFELGIIGIGNMGKAILSGIAHSEIIASDKIAICDINEEKAIYASNEFKVAHLQLPGLVEKSKYILIAVKPQNIDGVLEDIRSSLSDSKPLIISIAAGVKIKTIQKTLGNLSVIRCMPNISALVLKGITAISFSENCRNEEIGFTKNLFSSIGTIILVNETDIDAVTAISGSGPAYFFEFVRLLAKSGENIGLDSDTAKLLAEKTFTGSAMLFDRFDKSLAELIGMVTSKGGTTEAALTSFKENKLDEIIRKAVESAYKGASELSSD